MNDHHDLLQPSKIGGRIETNELIETLRIEVGVGDGADEDAARKNAAEAGSVNGVAEFHVAFAVHETHLKLRFATKRGSGRATDDTGFAGGSEDGSGFAAGINEKEDPAFAASDGDGFSDKPTGTENGLVGTETVIRAAINLNAAPPVGSVATDDASADGAPRGGLFDLEESAELLVFGALVLEFGDLPTEIVVVGTELVIGTGELATGVDERDEVGNAFKRRG